MSMVDVVHPSSVHDMTNAYDSTTRAFLVIARVVLLVIIMSNKEQVQLLVLCHQKRALQKRKLKHPWYVHQSNAYTALKLCQYEGCPGRKQTENKTKNQLFRTCTRCEEWVVFNDEKHMHFCNTTNNKGV